MKRKAFKVISFIFLFCIVFIISQAILHKRWNALYCVNKEYSQMKTENVDVLCFGTSEIALGYEPIVVFNENGMTGYNFAVAQRAALPNYYQFMQAIEYHQPKVVLCDFACMYDDRLPSEDSSIDMLYNEVVDTLAVSDLKKEMIDDILKIDDSRNKISWNIPLLRYHSLWSELDSSYFKSYEDIYKDYKSYLKGATINSATYNAVMFDVVPDRWDAEDSQEEFSEISMEYYDRIIDECNKRGIKVVAVLPPRLFWAQLYASRYKKQKEYFDSKGVYCLNYNTYEQVQRMNLDLENNYYDESHLNTVGAVKMSKALAKDLENIIGDQNHNNEVGYDEEWVEPYEMYVYDMLLEQPTLENYIELAELFDLRVICNEKQIEYSSEQIQIIKEYIKKNDEIYISILNDDNSIIDESRWYYSLDGYLYRDR